MPYVSYEEDISIHAPLAGGDPACEDSGSRTTAISIHAPLAGGDRTGTPSTPGASDFNPRPPRGGRRADILHHLRLVLISIHAPLAGGDVPTLLMALLVA